jgi:TRAP-type C4-dicarboxylate transport system permease small subunit
VIGGAFLNRLTRWLLVAGNVLLLLLLGLVGVEITLRNVFLVSTKIADEYSGYMFCWLCLFGFVYVARNDRFIRVEFLLTRLRGVKRQVLMVFGSICGLILSAIVCFATAQLAYTSYRFHAASAQYSQTPLAMPQVLMPAAFFLMAIVYVVELVKAVGGVGKDPS